MKIHGICLVKNEGDFIERSLRYDLKQFDAIYVFDNGSTDQTWEIIQRLAIEFPNQIYAWKTEDCDFRDELRGEVFKQYQHLANDGDWWCRLDGDEIYIDDPRTFLNKVPKSEHVVWSTHLQYYFSEVDAQRWKSDPELAKTAKEDFSDLPASYLSNAGEARFFRHRQGLHWAGAWPKHMGVVHPRRIRLKHYQYRSPDQIQKRLDTRREAAKRGYQTFLHSLESSWEEKIVCSKDFHQDRFDGNYQIDEHLLPRHLEKPLPRLVKRIMHTLRIWK